jgi:hypothetical protein
LVNQQLVAPGDVRSRAAKAWMKRLKLLLGDGQKLYGFHDFCILHVDKLGNRTNCNQQLGSIMLLKIVDDDTIIENGEFMAMLEDSFPTNGGMTIKTNKPIYHVFYHSIPGTQHVFFIGHIYIYILYMILLHDYISI